MSTAKVAITVEAQLLKLIDRWVTQGRYPNRSQAIQAAVREKVERWNHTRLAEEVAKLNPKEERALAEERVAGEAWPEF
jgi:Arc/MetJ-type ribon-helix-helix transcriptional regulator